MLNTKFSRRGLLLSAGCAGVVGVAAAALPQGPGLDLSGYRQSFATQFDRPDAPLLVGDGGPFTSTYESWGGLRTLHGNQEQQLYVDAGFPALPSDAPRYDPFSIKDGVLEIRAVPTPPAMRDVVPLPYVSGMLSTERSFAQRFGYFEMRAQLPAGQGLWPAFWMVAKTQSEHIEIDIFEALGRDTGSVFQSLHMLKARGPGVLQHVAMPGEGYDKGMHDYGLMWSERELRFYIDGRETLRLPGKTVQDSPPMYMIANLAVGGSWGGDADARTPFPAVMRVQHMRAYQRI